MVKRVTGIAITTMSSKGQIVIPTALREGMAEGDKFLIIRNDDKLILKKASEIDKNFNDDLIFAKRTEEAFRRYEQGKFKTVDAKQFLEDLARW